MLDDRHYMRRPPPPKHGFDDGRPYLHWLLWGLVIGYALQMLLLVWFGSDLPLYFALSHTSILSGYFWTLLSYGFLHGGLFHLLVNALVLFFAKDFLIDTLGHKRASLLVLAGILLGGIAWALLHLPTGGGGLLVGASAGVSAAILYFCLKQPAREISLLLFFVLPIRMSTRLMIKLILGMNLLGLLFLELPSVFGLSAGAGIGYSAHLGGCLAAWLWFLVETGRLGTPKLYRQKNVLVEAPGWQRRAAPLKARGASTINRTRRRDATSTEVDRILDKINEQGFGSLTAEEKATLDRSRNFSR